MSRKYTSTDATHILDGAADNNANNIPINTLVWDNSTSKMYRTLKVFDMKDGVLHQDNDDDDGSGATVLVTDGQDLAYVIGTWPNSWYETLDSGTSIGMNPLLVDDQGNNLLPDGVRKNFKVSRKASEVKRVLIGSNSCSNWSTATFTADTIKNEVVLDTAPTANQVVVVSYEDNAKPLQQSTPLPILQVGSKAIASNSHSWYKGGGIVNAVTGKVSVADVSKSLVSKSLEDAVLPTIAYPNIKIGERIENYKVGETFTFASGFNYLKTGIIYEALYNNSFTAEINDDFVGSGLLKECRIQPFHPTVNLTASETPTAKAFTTLAKDTNGELVLQVFGEEVLYDSTPVATLTADGTDADQDYSADNVYEITAGDHTGRKFLVTSALTDIKLDDYTLENDGSLRAADGTTLNGIKEWDGTGKWAVGFGDSGEFTQLTNGTKLDDNGNTVRTFVGIKKLGVYDE